MQSFRKHFASNYAVFDTITPVLALQSSRRNFTLISLVGACRVRPKQFASGIMFSKHTFKE